MSLLKAIHACTTLAAVQDLLATQVLTVEDLATADVYDLSEAIRSKGAAVCIFTRDDLDGRYDGEPAAASAWLQTNARRIGDRLAETGNQVIDDLLSGDGVLAPDPDDEDEIDEVEALIYGDEGHPSRSRTLEPGDIDALKAAGYTVNHKGEGWVFNDPDGNDDETAFSTMTTAWIAAKRDLATRPDAAGQSEGERTAFESANGHYWYVDEVQGGERYTIAKYLTEDQAHAIEGGAEPVDGTEGVVITTVPTTPRT